MPMPTTASICPLSGSIATIPPICPPSASAATRCTAGEIVVCTAGFDLATALASTRLPASSSPPGVPRSWSSSANSSPLVPTIASEGTPRASSSATRELGTGPTSPTTPAEAAPSGELRAPAAVAGPSASTDPSPASSAARGGMVIRLLSDWPACKPGKRSECDQITRGPSGPSLSLMCKLSASFPHSRVPTSIGTEIVSRSPSWAPPITLRLISVAVRDAA